MRKVLILLATLGFLAACDTVPVATGGMCRVEPAFTAAPANSCRGTRRVRLAVAGDVLLHWQLQQIGYSGGLTAVWQQAAPYFGWADIAIANMEGPVARGITRTLQDVPDPGPVLHTGVYTGYPAFNYHPVVLPQLAAVGVDMVTTANNHAMDRGARGVDLTLAALAEAGIGAIGTRGSDGAGGFVQYRDTGLGRVAFIACSFSTNGIRDRRGQVLLCYKNRDMLLSLVRAAGMDNAVAAVIVLPHWGQEYASQPDAEQMRLAQELADAGATAIIGTHPHAVQPVRLLQGQGGRQVPVFYSTGNFVAVQPSMPSKVGALAVLELCQGEDRRLAVGNLGWIATQMELTPEAFWLDIAPRDTEGPRALAQRHLSRIAPGYSAQPAACAVTAP